MDEQERSALGRYRSDLRNVIGSSASAYGYTLTVWSTGMVLSHTYGPPTPPLVISFFLGAVLAFAVVGILAFGGVTVEFGVELRVCYELGWKRHRNAGNGDREGTKLTVESAFLCDFRPSSQHTLAPYPMNLSRMR